MRSWTRGVAVWLAVGGVALALLLAPAHAQGLRQCSDCPEMVAVPAGRFVMGSPVAEAGREPREGPQREVAVAAFAIGRYEVTVGEFRRFVAETDYRTEAERNVGNPGCLVWDEATRDNVWRADRYWDAPGFVQIDSQPVVCVSWNDAQAYARWLSVRTGSNYRLPSEAEWEHAVRAGAGAMGAAGAPRYWGDDPRLACVHANIADRSRSTGWRVWLRERLSGWLDTLRGREGEAGRGRACDDGHAFTAPVGSYLPNSLGLYDMLGNVWEWTEDCLHDSYAGAPADSTAWTAGACTQRVMRGGSWGNAPQRVRFARRGAGAATLRDDAFGFRIARPLP